MGKVGEGAGRGFMAQVLGCDSMGMPDTGGRCDSGGWAGAMILSTLVTNSLTLLAAHLPSSRLK